MTVEVLRYSAFPEGGTGGNPAGVVLGAASLSDPQMLAIAEAIGYSETAFLSPVSDSDPARLRVRYFSPRAEVDFCGHATVASAVAIAERHGAGLLTMETNVGLVPVSTRQDGSEVTATLTSPATWTRPAGEPAGEALEALRLEAGDLDPTYPVHVAFAGNKHLVVGVRETIGPRCPRLRLRGPRETDGTRALDHGARLLGRGPPPVPRPQRLPPRRGA